jgi:hypothetical protein
MILTIIKPITDERKIFLQIINSDEVKLWLSKRELLDSKGITRLSDYNDFQNCIIPNDSGKKTALSRIITDLFSQECESLLWINEYGIWPSCEDQNLFHGFRESLGASDKLQDKPGHIFFKEDLFNISSLLSLILYFYWGAIIISSNKRSIVKISHDEVLEIFVKDQDDKNRKIIEQIKSITTTDKYNLFNNI